MLGTALKRNNVIAAAGNRGYHMRAGNDDFQIQFPQYYDPHYLGGIILLLEKYPTFFYENLVDFNEARLHVAILNLHTYA